MLPFPSPSTSHKLSVKLLPVAAVADHRAQVLSLSCRATGVNWLCNQLGCRRRRSISCSRVPESSFNQGFWKFSSRVEMIHGISWRGIDSHLGMWFHYWKVRGFNIYETFCDVFEFLDENMYASISQLCWTRRGSRSASICIAYAHSWPLWYLTLVMSFTVLSYLSHAIKIVPINHLNPHDWIAMTASTSSISAAFKSQHSIAGPSVFVHDQLNGQAPCQICNIDHCHYHLPLRFSPYMGLSSDVSIMSGLTWITLRGKLFGSDSDTRSLKYMDDAE